MGLELIIGGISALVGIFGAIGSANAASASAAAQKEGRAVEAASNETRSLESRRQRVREARIRRAQIIAASENAGTGKSSGQVGAVGAISTNLSGILGSSLGEGAAAIGINNANQRAADAETQGAVIGAWTGAIQSGLSGFSSIFDKKD